MSTHPALCSAADSLLLVVDIQPTLSEAMPEDEREQMLTNTGALLEAASTLDIPVLVTEQYPKGLGGTHQSIVDKLPATHQRFEKTGFSCCAAEGVELALQQYNRDQIIIVGQESHVCVLQTAMDLEQLGKQVFVTEDAVCSRNPKHKFYAIERMRRAGITISNYESILFEWLRDAAHPHFKKLAGLIR